MVPRQRLHLKGALLWLPPILSSCTPLATYHSLSGCSLAFPLHMYVTLCRAGVPFHQRGHCTRCLQGCFRLLQKGSQRGRLQHVIAQLNYVVQCLSCNSHICRYCKSIGQSHMHSAAVYVQDPSSEVYQKALEMTAKVLNGTH